MLDKENIKLEYKEQFTKSIYKTVSAFANYEGGKVLIGIEDSLNVCGVENMDETLLDIENGINDNIHPSPIYTLTRLNVDKKDVIELNVYKGEYTPYLYKNRAFKRSNTSTIEVNRFEFQKLILEGTNMSFEQLSVKGKNLTFNYLEKKIIEKTSLPRISNEVLITLGLLNHEYNNAALLISDNNDLGVIDLVAYETDDVTTIKDRIKLSNMSIVDQFDRCIDFYAKHTNSKSIIEGAYREDIEEIPLVAYREAVANAIVHRDYAIPSNIKVEVFTDRIEITSPGGLVNQLSESDFIEGKISISRNRIITDIFLRLKIIERLGTGIRRIKNNYLKSTRKESFYVNNHITVILPKISNSVDVDFNSSRLVELNDVQIKLFTLISEEGPLSRLLLEEKTGYGKTYINKNLNILLDKKLIMTEGKGKGIKYRRV